MAWTKELSRQLEAINDRLEQFDRIEAKLDAVTKAEKKTESVRVTATELEQLDGVGPTTARKILELIEGK